MNAVLRQHAEAIFQAGVAAANPYTAVQAHLPQIDLNAKHIHLIAFGKAACAMATAARDVLNLKTALAVTNYENLTPIDSIEVIGAGHPLPDAAGFAAAQKIAQRVSAAQHDDIVLVLISGGGSALIPYPVNGVSLADKIATTDLLLSCGATINEMNCVRKHLSQLKGGGLARLAAPARIHALILSDVLGDDLSSIASGATVPDDSTYAQAIAVLQDRKIWQHTPAAVREHLQAGADGKHPETPKSGDAIFQRTQATLIGSNALSVAASVNAAQNLGYQTQVYSNALCGNARDEAQKLARFAKQLGQRNQPLALIAGGETTVNLIGTGQGGRNQEFTLAFALAAAQHDLSGDWTLLSGGTDGRDGPTDAAGGVVDAGSLQRMTHAGANPSALLNNNDSYTALAASGDLLLTGSTGTNVADLQILLLR